MSNRSIEAETYPAIKVAVSPRFELSYALAARVRLPASADEPDWLVHARRFGEAFWVAFPDLLGDAAPEPDFAGFRARLEAVDEVRFEERIARGLFHGERARADRREWLAYIGAEDRDAVRRNWRAAAGPSLKRTALGIVEAFWEREFAQSWDALSGAFAASAERTRRLAEAAALPELARLLLLRIEVDEDRGLLKALRGGYTIPLAEIGAVVLLPSAYNVRRLWHAADERRPATVFAPYFDPAIAPPRPAPAEEFDPWLACRALGDPTRAAIVRALAAGETTAARLIGELGLSKANVSHHVFQLREAGLIAEEREGRTIRLRLRTDRLAELSGRLLSVLRTQKRDQP